jgi:hypothetical protein
MKYDDIIHEFVAEMQAIDREIAGALQSAETAKEEAKHWHLKRARVLAYPKVGLRTAIRIIEEMRDGR